MLVSLSPLHTHLCGRYNSSCKISLFSDTFRLTVLDFFGEFNNLTLNTCIYKPQLAAIRGPMTIKAWPDLRIRTGEVAKNLNFFSGKVGEFIWGPRFWSSFFVPHFTQQVTKRKYNSSWCLSGCHRWLFRCLHCLSQQ